MMKKLIQNIAYLFLLLASMTACTDENEKSPSYESGTIVLGLNYKVLSRAETEPGDDTYNENTISKADIFFYKDGNLTDCVFYPESVTLNAGAGSVTVKVPQDQLSLFEGTGRYTVYVIANGNFTRSELTGKSVDELRALSFETDLAAGAQSSFVMDGIATGITLLKDGVSGQVDLDRAASKIVLDITVRDKVESEDGTEYVPLKGNMTVSLYNGVKKTNIDTGNKPYAVTANDYFYTAERAIKEKSALQENEKSGHVPFYSYATSWTEDDPDETYLLLVVPWKVSSASGDSYTRYYYRVPINKQYRKLERNHLYKINLNVAVLGSTQKEEPVELNPNYLILDWGTEEIDTELKDFKYLVVDKNSVVINNKSNCSIGYASSSNPISVKVAKVILPNYEIDPFNKERELINFSTSDFRTSFDDKFITFSHDLTEEDYAPYTVILFVTNSDGYSENITITQYPKIYIDGERNTSTNDKGNVYINANHGTNSSDWDTVRGLAGNNKNPNMYVITVTAFHEGDNYKIGESRMEYSSTLNYNNWKSGADYWTSESRKIQYYYPSNDDDVLLSEVMIAPQFRIASSYGVVGNSISYSEAKRRCAAYQEFGYPAGRWRMPTIAEFKFIAGLSAKKKIPTLFNNGSGYWTAGAECTPQSNNASEPVKVSKGTDGTAFVRCVYDVWYWGNDQISNKQTFTWGDKQR